jgi:hypothetical protein
MGDALIYILKNWVANWYTRTGFQPIVQSGKDSSARINDKIE